MSPSACRSADLPAEALRADLLDSLRHEDRQGLWEAVWRLDCTPGQPEAVIASTVELARRVTVELLERGEIEIWLMNSWPPTAYTPVSAGQFLADQADDLLWFAPERGRRLYEIRLSEES